MLRKGASYSEFVNSVLALGKIRMHRDSNPSGVTEVKVETKLTTTESVLGLTNAGLRMHTDSSGVSVPPKGIGLYCEQPASSGGDSTFCNVEKLVGFLQMHDEELVDLLQDEGAAIFKGAGGVFSGPILTRGEGGVWNIRLRLDQGAFFNYGLISKLDVLQEAIAQNSFSVSMKEGDFYLLDNLRWLHGRTTFAGENRKMLRLLFD